MQLPLLSGLAPNLLNGRTRTGVVQELSISAWRRELPVLTGRAVLLREPTQDDVPALVDLMCIEDAARFGLEETIDEVKVARFVERAARDREAGAAITFIINVNASQRGVCGLIQVRAHDPSFESAEWEMT